MDWSTLDAALAAPAPAPEPPAAPAPQATPATATTPSPAAPAPTAGPTLDPHALALAIETWSEARDERAAILAADAKLPRDEAEREADRLHPHPAGPEVAALAGPDWPAIARDPQAIAALLRLQATRAARHRGRVPSHYTTRALCATCGPVWLWPGAPAHVIACPWCLDPPRAPIPRPLSRCGDCQHYQANPNSAAGLGRCDSPQRRHGNLGPHRWPGEEHPCPEFRPRS